MPHEPEFRRRRGTQPVAHVFQRHASAAVLQQHDRSRRNRPAAHHKLFLRVFAFMNNIISASCRLDKNLFSAIIVILSSSNCCIRSPPDDSGRGRNWLLHSLLSEGKPNARIPESKAHAIKSSARLRKLRRAQTLSLFSASFAASLPRYDPGVVFSYFLNARVIVSTLS